MENVPIFSVKLVDGFTKSLCVQAVFGLMHHMAASLIFCESALLLGRVVVYDGINLDLWTCEPRV